MHPSLFYEQNTLQLLNTDNNNWAYPTDMENTHKQ